MLIKKIAWQQQPNETKLRMYLPFSLTNLFVLSIHGGCSSVLQWLLLMPSVLNRSFWNFDSRMIFFFVTLQ